MLNEESKISCNECGSLEYHVGGGYDKISEHGKPVIIIQCAHCGDTKTINTNEMPLLDEMYEIMENLKDE